VAFRKAQYVAAPHLALGPGTGLAKSTTQNPLWSCRYAVVGAPGSNDTPTTFWAHTVGTIGCGEVSKRKRKFVAAIRK
jgi:hypothetical protein